MLGSCCRGSAAALSPLRPVGRLSCNLFSTSSTKRIISLESPAVARALPASYITTARLSKEQHYGIVTHRDHLRCGGSGSTFGQHQIRSFHASKPLHARGNLSGLRAKIQDKIQKFRQDENAMQKLMGIGAVGYSVAKVSKFGVVLKFAFPVLKMTKALPLLSMGLTTVLYSCFFGVPFAVGIVCLLFTSQASRALVLKRFGCEVQPMAMIPFLGTTSTGGENTDYTKTEEYVLQDKPFKRCLVALSPVVGMFLFTAAAPLGVGGLLMGSQCGYAVANTGFMMGMFSLLPLGDMTPGGQLLNYFSKNALLLGTGFNVAVICVFHNPILYLCLVLNLWRLYQRGFVMFGRQFGGDEDQPVNQSTYGLSANYFSDQQKVIVGSIYWSLFLLNAGGLAMVGKFLLTPQKLVEQQKAEEREQRFNVEGNQLPRGNASEGAEGFGADTGGWNFGVSDWAMRNLNAVEELDRDEDDEARQREWARQLAAAQHVPREELLGR